MRSKHKITFTSHPYAWALALAVLVYILFTSQWAVAAPYAGHSPGEVIDKERCLGCHSDPKLVKRAEAGKFKVIAIDGAKFNASVHGFFDCTACHKEFGLGFHADPELDEETEQEFTKFFAEKSRSSHQALISCLDCHTEEYSDYRESVHGKALMDEGVPDAPYCTDCHGKHYIKSKDNPTSATYLPNIPVVCADCHNDESLLLRYNLDATVFRGYYETYHGKKQELGNVEVPVCTTCHTAHSIKAHDDPASSVYGEAGERTCGECHTGADASFLMAFTHKLPTLETAPVVYIVRWFYTWILTVVILGMTLYIVLDLFAQIRLRLRGFRESRDLKESMRGKR